MYFSLYFGINFRVFYLYCVCVLLASSLFQFDLLPSCKVKAMLSDNDIGSLVKYFITSNSHIDGSKLSNHNQIVFISLKLKGIYDLWIKNKNKLTIVHIHLRFLQKLTNRFLNFITF